MSRLLVLVIALIACTAVSGATIVFENVTVVPMDSERSLPHHSVVVEDGRITLVAPTGALTMPAGAQVIDGEGRWLMPGLGEMHAHVPPAGPKPAIDAVLALFLANGITTARGVLGSPAHLELRDELASGRRFGPRLVTSGPSLNGNSVDGPEHAIELVEAQKAAGYDLAKLHPGLGVAEYDAIMATARRVGLPVTGHVSADVGLEHVLSRGQACIEHLDDYVRALVPADQPARTADPGFFGLNAAMAADRDRMPVLVAMTLAAGTAISPTETLMVSLLGTDSVADLLAREESAYVSAATRAQWRQARENLQGNPAFDRAAADRFLALRRELLRALHDAGVTIVLGSDAPQVFNVPGFSAHRELALMVEAGLSPYEALRTGTVAVARHLGVSDRGTVAPGMAADLVLLDADPLADIGNAMAIRGVMVAGRWHDRESLDAVLAGVRRAVAD